MQHCLSNLTLLAFGLQNGRGLHLKQYSYLQEGTSSAPMNTKLSSWMRRKGGWCSA